MIRRRALIAAATALAVPALAQPAWPTRPVRLILPDAPGSGNDTTARLIAPLLEAALGQPFVPDNRGGAGGRIGVEAAFRATPDGTNFLRRPDEPARIAPYEYLWDPWEQIVAAAEHCGTQTHMSSPFQRFEIGGGPIAGSARAPDPR